MSIDQGMNKEDMVVYTVQYYSTIKEGEIMLFAATWMDLEIIILSEVSQKKSNINLILFVESKKNDANVLIYTTETDSQT